MFVLLLCLVQVSWAFIPDSPIVGILSVPVGAECITLTSKLDQGGSCFHSLYVKWLEQSGAQIVPIPYDLPHRQLDQLLDRVDGVLFTGGQLFLQPNMTYQETSKYIYDRVIEKNKNGIYFPLWGTCQGFQVISILASRNYSILSLNAFDSEGLNIPLEMSVGARKSKLFQSMSGKMFTQMSTDNLTCNLHANGVRPADFHANALISSDYRIISTNIDRKGNRFVSTIESNDFPIFAVQWHPERPQFDFSSQEIAHSDEANRAMQYFANFFVDECRKNSQVYPNDEILEKSLIYNYQIHNQGHSREFYYFPDSSSIQ